MITGAPVVTTMAIVATTQGYVNRTRVKNEDDDEGERRMWMLRPLMIILWLFVLLNFATTVGVRRCHARTYYENLTSHQAAARTVAGSSPQNCAKSGRSWKQDPT